MNRAYSLFNLKAFDPATRTFSGIASTPTPDRMGDVVEPLGAQFNLPLPFLYQHDSASPIGKIHEAVLNAEGISIRGEVAQIDAPPSLKERLDVAWAEMQSGLVRGLSIGFNPKEWEPLKGKGGGLRFKSWEFLELSLVTIPANQEASITTVKQFDARVRAALGQVPRKGVALLTSTPCVEGQLAATHPGAVLLNPRRSEAP